MAFGNTIKELLLSRDKDNIAIATEMLRTYPTLIDITLQPLLNYYYSEFENRCDGLMGDGNGGNTVFSYFSNYGNGNCLYDGGGCGAVGLNDGDGYSGTR
tara:strand:+ start:255 stop:554 length:300 start_codon:yes stop_codon:yes gene_type:complete